MTKQEIKDLVAAKIAGQGTQIDLGGALPAILNAIVDLIGVEEIPVASAEVLGGVKVGSGLGITPDGVLSATADGPLMVELEISMDHSASIVGAITKRQLLEALQSGRPVVGYVPGPYGVDSTYLCRLSELGDSNGIAVFFGVTRTGEVEYCYVTSLGS